MAENTAISWTRSTFNPWIGCTKVGPGCDSCYAETLDKRHRWGGDTHWGDDKPRHRTSSSYWTQPFRWDSKAAAGDHPWRVFCASLADVFDNQVPGEWRADLWRLIAATPNLDWLLVTKRIGNVAKMVPGAWTDVFPSNVRLMITVVNQEEADRDVPKLLALNCRNGVSYEPALGPVDWGPYLGGIKGPSSHRYIYDLLKPRIEWIIIGGESDQGSHKARPFRLTWARRTIQQCRDAGVPSFMKQLGSAAYSQKEAPLGDCLIELKDRAGADPAEWPEDFNAVQEFPA